MDAMKEAQASCKEGCADQEKDQADQVTRSKSRFHESSKYNRNPAFASPLTPKSPGLGLGARKPDRQKKHPL